MSILLEKTQPTTEKTDVSIELDSHQMLIGTAQTTLTDLDKTILELSALVDGLKSQSEKLAI